MKKYLYYVGCILLIVLICFSAIPAFAVDGVEQSTDITDEEVITEAASEEIVTSVPSGEIAEDILDIVENADTKDQAILKIAEKLGITSAQAEDLIDSVIALGDEYLGDSSFWLSLKTNIQENMQFWVTALVCFIAVVAIIIGAVVLLAKTNPALRKALRAVADALKITKESAATNSHTLGNIDRIIKEVKEQFEVFLKETAEKEDALRSTIEEKDTYIAELVERMVAVEELNEAERKQMLSAFANNLRILKLICDRTPLPVSDKATIDLWCAKATQDLKNGLAAEDIQKIEEMSAMLDNVGGQDGQA